MAQSPNGRDNVTIGILGTVQNASWSTTEPLTPCSPKLALQGAFAEHQVMLQKLSVKRKVIIVLVRQQEDLDKCDALIIPGGGASWSPKRRSVTHKRSCNIRRVNHHRPLGSTRRSARADEGVPQNEACLGDVCRRDPSRALDRRREEGRSRAPWWRLRGN